MSGGLSPPGLARLRLRFGHPPLAGRDDGARVSKNADSIFKQPSKIARGMFRDAAASSVPSPHKREGAERRKALLEVSRLAAGLARPTAGRRARILRCVRLPALHRGICRRTLQGSFRHQPQAAFLEPAFSPANAASSSQSARSGARAVPRGRPSARLRASPAGAAPRSTIKTSHDDALDEQGSNVHIFL